MSIYSVKGKGWRYDFTHKGIRYTETWFKTKTAARKAEAKKLEELTNPVPKPEIPIDTDFLTLINMRLDYVKQYNSEEHFRQTHGHARRWMKEWKRLLCSEITSTMIEQYIIRRSKVSAYTANKDLRLLRALFTYGIKRKMIQTNPTEGINFLPEIRKKKYVPSKADVLKVINVADPDTQDYLWTILLTAARVGEINSLVWEDVDFKERFVTLWTRKKRGGNKESRDVPMVKKLYDILYYRYRNRDRDKPWVFWHAWWDRKRQERVAGPYKERKRIMRSLCRKADVKYFRFHPLRHLTASMLDDLGIPIGVIQRILGHENRKTTERYLHSIGEAEREAMNKLATLSLFSTDLKGERKDKIEKPINMPKEFWLRKVVRPDYETLCREIETMGYVGTGKKYGVSDNAVRM